ncbi:hypothetical protein AX14_002438 [Amanita brunnescens Koide BX004]|nr:hypothetical protein AX14_002438 [Amanita brunnescens Koide BX004]
MQGLNYNANTYLAITLSPGSQYLQSPPSLVERHSSLVHLGNVGQLEDVHLYGVPKAVWQREGDNILEFLKELEGRRGRAIVNTSTTLNCFKNR